MAVLLDDELGICRLIALHLLCAIPTCSTSAVVDSLLRVAGSCSPFICRLKSSCCFLFSFAPPSWPFASSAKSTNSSARAASARAKRPGPEAPLLAVGGLHHGEAGWGRRLSECSGHPGHVQDSWGSKGVFWGDDDGTRPHSPSLGGRAVQGPDLAWPWDSSPGWAGTWSSELIKWGTIGVHALSTSRACWPVAHPIPPGWRPSPRLRSPVRGAKASGGSSRRWPYGVGEPNRWLHHCRPSVDADSPRGRPETACQRPAGRSPTPP